MSEQSIVTVLVSLLAIGGSFLAHRWQSQKTKEEVALMLSQNDKTKAETRAEEAQAADVLSDAWAKLASQITGDHKRVIMERDELVKRVANLELLVLDLKNQGDEKDRRINELTKENTDLRSKLVEQGSRIAELEGQIKKIEKKTGPLGGKETKDGSEVQAG